jgi:hypothetical protein
MAIVAVPVLTAPRWPAYTAASFALSARGAQGTDVAFTPVEVGDRALHVVAPGVFFFVAAGTTVTPLDGPTITAGADRHVLLVHNVEAWEWAGALAPIGQPLADWWALEGVSRESVEAFLDGLPLDNLASARNFASGADLRTEVLAGRASITVLDTVAIGELEVAADGRATLGVSCFAGSVEVNALSALATLSAIDPALAPHPLIAAAGAGALASDISIHVKFVHFAPKTTNAASAVDKGDFAPIPARPGATIALQKRTAAGVFEDLVSAPTGAGGQVALLLPRADLAAKVSLAAGDTLLFRLRLPGATFVTQYQHDNAPREANAGLSWRGVADEWATEGLVTTDRSVTSLDFIARADPATGATIGPAGTSVGSAAQPLEYYAGVPLFAQVQYPVLFVVGGAGGAGQLFRQEMRAAPKGVVLTLRNAAGVLGTFRTDEHGQVWGSVTTWNPDDVALEARVEYRMEDPSIRLVEISGAVNDLGAANEARFFSSLSDTEHPLSFGFGGTSIGQRIQVPGDVGLETLQVGSIAITNADQNVASASGRHAAVLFAFQHIRYIHQWFHHLTSGYPAGPGDLAWSTLLEKNTNGAAGVFAMKPPMVRVLPVLPAAPVRMGEVDVESENVMVAGVPTDIIRWVLKLYGNENFSLGGAIHQGGNVVEMWRVHTIWHEYTHAVFKIAYDLMPDLPGIYIDFNAAKDASTSWTVNVPHDGWSTLDEAFAAIPEVALLEQISGRPPVIAANPAGVQQFWTAEPRPGGGANYYLDEGLLVARAPNPKTGKLERGALDKRLGLRVPEAFTWALWTLLKKLGGFRSMAALCAATRGIPTAHDLRDDVPYLKTAADALLFQRVVWEPLMTLRAPDFPGPPLPRKWDDIDPAQLGAPNGDHATSPLMLVNGPTTLRLIEIFKDSFYPLLPAADRAVVRNLYGDVPDPAGAQPTDQIAYYLWFLPW